MSNLSDLLPAGAGAKTADFTANGAIASGKPVIIESSGDIAQVAESTVSPDAPIGSRTLVDGNNTEYFSIAADPHNENRWVACYSDDIGNKDLFMKVFTRSGNTITQSSAISLITGGSSNRDVCVCFDKGQENVVLLMYNNNSNDGVVQVATISGSAGSESVSLGTATDFYTSQPIFTANQKGCVNLINLDTSGNFLGIWIDANGADGTIKGRVFQVSGTSVTAGGSTTNLATDCGSYSQATRAIREHYSDTTKAYLAYRDDDSKVAMKVLTISGTSISAGTKYQSTQSIDEQGVSISPISDTKIIVSSAQNSQNYPGYHLVTDDSGSLSYGTWTIVSSVSSRAVIALNNKNNNQLVFPFYYSYTSGSLFPFVKILTSNSDGSTITFSTEDQLESSSAIANSFNGAALQEDSLGHYLVVGEYSSDLYFILGKVGGNQTNLTATNFVGISDAAISDDATGTIVLQGGVTENLSSLTTGSTYYVLSDGTLEDAARKTYDISGASYTSKSFSVSSQESNPNGIAFNTDGTKMLVVGSGGDDVNEYALSTAFDVTSASFTDSFSVATQATTPNGLTFNTDGTAMYVADANTDTIYQYTLTTGFDVSTASYASKSTSISSQDTDPEAVAFNSDGTKMFLLGDQNKKVYEYTVSTGFDLGSTVTYVRDFSVNSQETGPRGLTFNSDGTKMFVVGYQSDTVYQYNLTTGFDLSTASYASISFSVSSEASVPQGITFNATGNNFYVIGSGAVSVFQYDTTTDGGAIAVGKALSTNKLLLRG